MMIRVLVNGAKGRMGQEAVKTLTADSECEVVAELDKGDDLAAVLNSEKPDVALDLTAASVGFENACTIIDANVSPVLGTSGFTDQHVAELMGRANEKKVSGIVVPNFAIGAVLLMQFSKQAAKYFEYAEVIELHHEKKEEFPSGTAIRTAEMIASESDTISSRKDEGRGVNHRGVPIHSVRMPGYTAHEEVVFGGEGQVLTLRHDSMGRSSFMPGVLLACKKVQGLNSFVCGLEHLLCNN